jgi:hypothetical protein
MATYIISGRLYFNSLMLSLNLRTFMHSPTRRSTRPVFTTHVSNRSIPGYDTHTEV